MGSSRWDDVGYRAYSCSVENKPREQVYTARSIEKKNDPKLVKVRESRDSVQNPNSTALIFALDVTGSMGFIAEEIAKVQLGKLVGNILENSPVADPHLMFMGIGDASYDKSPLQVTQFEADNCIIDQLTKIWLEGGGGGNHYESYDLAWAFAAYKTSIDCWEKRKKKGYLFTFGDEEFPKSSSKSFLHENISGDVSHEVTPKMLYDEASLKYHCFHVIVEQGDYARNRKDSVYKDWEKYLGKRVLRLDNYEHLPQLVVSAISISEGKSVDSVINNWSNGVVKATLQRAFCV